MIRTSILRGGFMTGLNQLAILRDNAGFYPSTTNIQPNIVTIETHGRIVAETYIVCQINSKKIRLKAFSGFQPV